MLVMSAICVTASVQPLAHVAFMDETQGGRITVLRASFDP
jgi:hypothetical protein